MTQSEIIACHDYFQYNDNPAKTVNNIVDQMDNSGQFGGGKKKSKSKDKKKKHKLKRAKDMTVDVACQAKTLADREKELQKQWKKL